MARYRPDDLCHLAHSILVAAGVDAGDAAVVADNLIAADRRGIHSHGLARLPLYVAKVEAGSIEKKTVLTTVRETPSVILIDAANGWGAVAGKYAMEQAIRKAGTAGMAAAAVRYSNHFGIAAYYGLQAIEHDMIGLVLSNSVPAMAPWGGREVFLGTNPICICAPTEDGRPIVYDGATSVVAKGKVTLAYKAGLKIPPTWGADTRGRPTTDPGEALDGTLLPIGGYKGSGLSFAIDILCGVLTGSAFGGDVGSLFNDWQVANIGHFMAAVKIETFMPVREFKARLSQMASAALLNPLADGSDRILMPGEIEADKEEEARQRGIFLQPGIIDDLAVYADKYGLVFPSPLAVETASASVKGPEGSLPPVAAARDPSAAAQGPAMRTRPAPVRPGRAPASTPDGTAPQPEGEAVKKGR